MKEEKGIQFNIVTEEEAVEFLSFHSYYFKVKAFEKNYNTGSGIKEGKYYDLEFAYLEELSKLDMYLRKIILDITLDIEHFLKVKMLRVISDNPAEDGYTIVKDFFDLYPNIKDEIFNKIETSGETSYIYSLVTKYKDSIPVWVFFEITTFGQLLSFCEYYQQKYPKTELKINNLKTVKYLRNAAAHNNCLINDLSRKEQFAQSREANSFVQKIKVASPQTQNKKMGNRFVHDFVTMLVVFQKIVSSENVKKAEIDRLKQLFDERFVKHREYFKNNGLLVSNYDFVKKIIDKIADCAYTI